MEEELPLSALYEKAVRICEHENVSTSSQAEQLQEAEGWLQQCGRIVNRLSLFSPNEEAEDVATGDLKYLLVPFHLAKLKARTQKQEPQARRQILEDAKHFFARFLHACDLYSLIPAEAKLEDPTDPTTKRQQKIERFRREKAAKARLATAEQTLLARKRLKILDDAAESEGDEEAEREAWLTKIELAVLEAAEQTQLVEQEIGLLRHAEKLPEEERRQPQQQPPADLLQQLRQAAASLETRREQIRADVLKPSHNLPTRTLREQAEIELEQARRVEESQRRAKLKQEELEADEDFQIQKQRAWDDWKDDNPRGAGNSRLRPTA